MWNGDESLTNAPITVSGNDIDIVGNLTINSRLTFDYGGDHYFEAGTDSLSYKNSSGGSVITLNASTLATTFSGTVTADNFVKATNAGTENAMLQASATGTGFAGMYLDASNGDFSGNDYFSIRQLNDLSVEFDARSGAGVTVFKSKGSTNLTMDGANSTFAGSITASSSSSAQLQVSGWSHSNGANNANGSIYLGNTGAYRGVIDYDAASSGSLIISNTWNNDAGNIVFKTKTAGTDVIPLTLSGSGNATFAGTVYIPSKLEHTGDSNTFLNFSDDTITLSAGGSTSTIAGNGTATFAGDVLVEDNLYLTDAGTVRGKIQLNSSDRDNVDIKAISLGSTMNFFTADTLALGLDASQNATFAGTVSGTEGNFSNSVEAGALLKFGTNGNADIVNIGTGAIRFKPSSQTLALTLAGANATFAGDITVGDDVFIADSGYLNLGSGNDLFLVHDGADAIIRNNTGHIYFDNLASNKEIYVRGNDGGSTITALRLDMSNKGSAYFNTGIAVGDSSATSTFAGNISLADSKYLYIGSSNDLRIYHDSTNSKIENDTGQLRIINNAVDKSIMLQATSNGSGSDVTESYLSLLPSFGTGAVFIYKDVLMAQDDTKIRMGASQDLEIYHDGSNSYIKDTGTGVLYIQGSGNVQIEGINGENMIICNENGSVQLHYNNVQKFQTTSSGIDVDGSITLNDYIYHSGDTDTFFKFNSGGWEIQSSGGPTTDISATGGVTSIYGKGQVAISCGSGQLSTFSGNISPGTNKVLDRDIPCLFNSNFEDGYGTSIIVVPFNNNTESNVSTRTYNHNLTMPYAGKLTKIIMKHVSGSLSSSFTTQLFLYVNGSQQASSSEISLSNSSVIWTPTTNNTFSAGDVLTFAYQKSAIKTFGGVSFGVAIELTDYDI